MGKVPANTTDEVGRTVVFPETRRGSCLLQGKGADALYDVDFPQVAFNSEDPVIDSSILNLVERFNLEDAVVQAIREFVDDLSATMVGLRNAFTANDMKWLDQVAQELSQYALKVGAVRVLKLAFDIQASARRNDARHLESLVNQIETEYKKAKEFLAGYI